MTIVRIVLADPRSGRVPERSAVNGQQLIVLADDTGHRAVPLWLRVIDAKLLWGLLERSAGDAVIAGVLEETAARLLYAAGVRVTTVDIEPAGEDEPELRPGTAAARVGLATAAGDRHVRVSAGYGLRLAVVAGVPVRVADAVMDRLAVPVPGEDMRAPFLPPADALPPGRPARRFEPRNMAFTEGLDYWDLAGSFSADGPPAGPDYSCTAADQSAVLAASVPEPDGSAILVQAIVAEDYRGRTVTFRGQLRAIGLAGQAGLHLAVTGPLSESIATRPLLGHGSSLTASGSSDWTWHEVTVPVPGEAAGIRFGVSLAGRGRIELRGAELTPAPPETRE